LKASVHNQVSRLTRADDKLVRSLCHFVELIRGMLLVQTNEFIAGLGKLTYPVIELKSSLLSLMQPCSLQMSAVTA